MSHLKLKDLFTSLNLFLSFYSIVLVFEGYFVEASTLIFINVIILDMLDGYVARLTKTFNDFGKHFDSIVDFIGSSMTVPFFIYHAFKNEGQLLALVFAFLPLLAGVLRDILAQLEKIKATTFFIGLPRNTAALTMIAYLNSTFFTVWNQFELGLILIAVLCSLQISHVPFIGNDKKQLTLPKRVKGYLILAIFLLLASLATGAFWDTVFLLLVAYMASPWILADKEIWHSIKQQLQKNKYDTRRP